MRKHNLGISSHDLLALGRQDPNNAAEPFNIAYLAIRGSAAVNGVSQLHGRVSRHLFGPLFPRWPHCGSADGACDQRRPYANLGFGGGRRYLDGSLRQATLDGRQYSDAWGRHSQHTRRSSLAIPVPRPASPSLNTLASDCPAQLATYGTSSDAVDVQRLFDSNTLTLGFARRFATYKRPNHLLHDPERLLRLLNDQQRPVQLIIAGKAHPADHAGAGHDPGVDAVCAPPPEARRHVVFLSDYDMHLTEHLVQGVDVWLNTPRRPWEACGTSGMKVLVNGGINLSELDGWWAEAYSPEIGWALGDGQEHDDAPAWDAIDAEALYNLLEQQVVIPEFYTRDQQGIPTAWVTRIRESMARLTPRFSTNRTVGEYTERFYLPESRGLTFSAAADAGCKGGRVIAE